MKATIEIGTNREITCDLSDFSYLRYMNIEFTSVCNLRCTYCHVSDVGWQGRPMSDEILDACITVAYGKTSIQRGRDIVLGCTSVGEITTMRNWVSAVQPYIKLAAQSGRATILSNLQKVLSDEEVDAFSQFHSVSFSLDTIDRETLTKVRRKSSLPNITMNLMRIRARAYEAGRPQPYLTLNCVVTDFNALQIYALGSFAVACGVKRLYLIDLDETEINDPTIERRPKKVSSLPKSDLRQFVYQISKTQELMKQHGGSVSASGNLERLIKSVAADNPPSEDLKEGETRICTQLWDTLFLRTDGGVNHCCGPLDSGARIDRNTSEEIVDNPTVRKWRQALLSGQDLPPICRTCHWARPGPVRELQDRVAQLHGRKAVEVGVEPDEVVDSLAV